MLQRGHMPSPWRRGARLPVNARKTREVKSRGRAPRCVQIREARQKRKGPAEAGPFAMVGSNGMRLKHLPAVARQQGDGLTTGLDGGLHGEAPVG